MLKLSDKPVSKAFKKLEEAKLIYEIRSGFKKHNIIFVGKIVHQSVEKTMNRIMSDSWYGENTIHESEIVRQWSELEKAELLFLYRGKINFSSICKKLW